MVTTAAAPDVYELAEQLRLKGACRLASDATRSLLLARDERALADWDAFRGSWERMPRDRYMADGGTYRRRRHATLSAPPSSTAFRLEPHQPHYQERTYNNLNGGIARHYEPIEAPIVGGSTFTGLLRLGLELFGSVAPDWPWHIEAHQFRIEADGTEVATPTPEGTHRDGVSFVMMVLVERVNVADGSTTIYDLEQRPLDSFTLTEPLEMAVVDDERTMHGVTPIRQLDPSRPGHRDLLVITFRRTQ